MSFLALLLLLLLLAALAYIWATANRGGGLAPGRRLPEPEPEPQSGTYYEITNVCYTLARDGMTNRYSKLVFASTTVSHNFTITKTTVKGLPSGAEALLTYNYYPHGQPNPNGVTKSNTALADGKSTAEFNGLAGVVARSQFPNDFIKWEASLTSTSGTLPDTIEVCVNVKREA